MNFILISLFMIVNTVFNFQENQNIFSSGDMITIIILNENDINREVKYTIQSDGSIVMPLIGKIFIKGLTIEETQAVIESLLDEYYVLPEILILPAWKVSIIGEVRAPGQYLVDGGTTISDLFSKAGGGDSRADLKKSRLYRNGEQINFNMNDCMRYQIPEYNPILQSGDIIYIEKAWWPSWSEWGSIMGTVTFGITLYSFLRTLD